MTKKIARRRKEGPARVSCMVRMYSFLHEKLKEKIRPIDEDPEEENELLQLRHRRLQEMQALLTPDIIHALDEQLEKQARRLKPHKKKGRTG